MAAKAVSPATRNSHFAKRLKVTSGLRITPTPPAFSNLQFWFDITDESTVFSDVAGTVKALNGDVVRNVTNKGYDSTAVPALNSQSSGAGELTQLFTNSINGLQALGVDTPGGQILIFGTGDTTAGGATEMTVAAVGSKTAFQGGFSSNEFAAFGQKTISSAHSDPAIIRWQGRHGPIAAFNSNKRIVPREFVWGYLTSTDEDHNLRISGDDELNFTGVYTPVVSGAPGFIIQDGLWTEGFLWDRVLTPTERLGFIDYCDIKYGTLPFTP